MSRCLFHILNYRPRKAGAIERFLVRLARESRGAGFDSFFLFREEPVDWFRTQLAEHAELGWAGGSPVSGRGLRRAIRFLRRTRPAVVTFSYVPLFSPGALLITRLPCVAHSVFMDRDSGLVSVKHGPRRWLARARGRLAARCYDAIVSVSEYNRRRNVSELFIPARKTLVIPNGVELNGVAPATAEPGRYLFYAGQLTPEKGVITLLRAFAYLVQQHPERAVELWLAGEGPLSDVLPGLSVWPAVKDRVRLLGVRDDVPALMAASIATVVPSEWPEAFGLTAVEAMASGRPVIASDAGALPENIADCGLVFQRGDVEALAALLIRVTGPGAPHAGMVERARAHVRDHFSLERMVENYLALFAKVAGTPPVSASPSDTAPRC